nr:angiomotin-like protein 2 [Ciona intestinalis]|eukprot:XP_002130117.1 angiomotin-like protein 2 [Ciona intestinalis]
MSDIRSDSTSSTVLQRLLAEHYRARGSSGLTSPMALSGFEPGMQDCSFENEKCKDCGLNNCNCHAREDKMENTQFGMNRTQAEAARLDSLCRSTLITTDSSPYNTDYIQDRKQARRPPPTYSEQRPVGDYTSVPVVTQQLYVAENRSHEVFSSPVKQQDFSQFGNNTNVTNPKRPQGHPKSNSGDDYLYTDYLRKSGREAHKNGSFGNLSGKTSSVVRSSSLHQAQDHLLERKLSRKVHRMSMEEEKLELVNRKHKKQNRPKSHSEISAIFDFTRQKPASMDSHDLKGASAVSLSSFQHPDTRNEISAVNMLDSLVRIQQSQISPCMNEESYNSEPKSSDSGLPSTPGSNKTIYMQGQSSRNFYQNKGIPSWQKEQQNNIQQQRRPPPPYPDCPTSAEPTQHPIRPNTLPLGDINSMKSNENQLSPVVCMADESGQLTPIQGTGFYSNQRGLRYVQHVNPRTPITSGSPHYIRRTGSGNSVRGVVVQSPCCTPSVVTDSAQNYIPVASTPTKHGERTNLTHAMEMDFMNQTDDSYRVAYRSKQSSSNGRNTESNFQTENRSKAQPHLVERLELENENLHSKLQSTLQKLKKFETIEADLKRLTEDHRALYQSAAKREALETEMRTSLSSQVRVLDLENTNLKNQLMVATKSEEILSQVETKKENLSEIEDMQKYEAKNRKLLESERELLEELEERRERMLEQKEDIDFLSNSLQKSQDTINHLKEQLKGTNVYETYVDELSILRNIVAERQQVEKALLDSLSHDLAMKHTNDDDAAKGDVKTVIDDAYISKDSQMLRIKAELVKWQHIYLKQDLIHSAERAQKERQASEYHKHRHTISDSGVYGCDIPSLLNMDDHTDDTCVSGLKTDDYFPRVSLASTRKDFSCQTPDDELSATTIDQHIYRGCEVLSTSQVAVAVQTSNKRNSDVPSEGYHSQQSSGSPTPNGDKSTLYFPECNSSNKDTRFRTSQCADV